MNVRFLQYDNIPEYKTLYLLWNESLLVYISKSSGKNYHILMGSCIKIRYAYWHAYLRLLTRVHYGKSCVLLSISLTILPFVMGIILSLAPWNSFFNCLPPKALSRNIASAAISECGWFPIATL